jgi:putative two-component system response regulator
MNMAERVIATAALPAPGRLEPAAAPAERAIWDGVRTPTLLVVDDTEINRRLLKAMLKAEPYRILEARRATEALVLMEREEIDLVILDLIIPEMSGLEFCRRLKADRRNRLVPVVIMTSVQGIDNEIAGIASGADEFLTKPLHPTLLRTRIQALLRHKAAIDSLEEAESILFALAQAVEQRDKCTGDHCQRLATYSVALGMALGVSRPELLALYRGGYLHDIGKIAVPDAVLFKPGKLNEEEWTIMRSHTWKGENICRPMKTLAPVLPIIRNHHERWDGTGYPDGLAGEQIPLLSRILQVADIYDALTSERPYKRAFSHEEAVQVLSDEADRGWRDPALVSLFSELCVRAVSFRPEVSGDSIWSDATAMQTSLANMNNILLNR